jgi:hypothetical protein
MMKSAVSHSRDVLDTQRSREGASNTLFGVVSRRAMKAAGDALTQIPERN